MSTLNEICARKRVHITAQKERISLESLQESARTASPPRGFLKALKNAQGPALIAEVKKASPSKGIIREDFDPVEIAKIYERSGAACISVLTDEPYFQGCDPYLKAVKEAVKLPLLRKDFMLEPYQIYESRALGADCILLIMAALNDSQAADLFRLSKELGMDVLVEIHDAEELERAKNLSPDMIGVNNRNLKTLEVNIETSKILADSIPSSALKVAESGITSAATIQNLYAEDYKAFLIGESLMRQENIAQAIEKLFPQ